MLQPLPNPLPSLRDDLKLHAAPAHGDGSPAWTIHDPVTNAFYRIGWLEFEFLSRWELGDPAAILTAVDAGTLLEPTVEELSALYAFLLEHQLLMVHTSAYTNHLLERCRRSRPGFLSWLLHNYLFFRIPLIRPNLFLRRLLPWINWIFRPTTAWVLLALSLFGLFLTAQQWDLFSAGFKTAFSPAGIFGYLLALAFTKSLHELGHALTATRYGLRVGHMGIAFLVLWPMLYTDTGEVWRLADHKQRLDVVSAGLLSELALAGLATLAWNLTTDADLKQVFFFLATTAWMLSLLLNMSPFMRFDGYFILSDILDLPNLHERSFALARTALRNLLFGWNDPWPENFSPWRRRALVVFALCTWMYRFVVFTGIAFTVYYLFTKVLGIFLFAVEIVWFVARPIYRELQIWFARRAEITPSRKLVALLCAVLLLPVLLVPWQHRITAPGWAHPARSYVFYSPTPARLVEAPPTTGRIAADSVAFRLEQPQLVQQTAIAQAKAQAIQHQLAELLGRIGGEEERAGLYQEWARYDVEAKGLRQQAERLVLQAPFTGTLTDVDPELAVGSWVSPKEPLGILVDPQEWSAEAYVGQTDLERIDHGAKILFYPANNSLAPLAGSITAIDDTRIQQLPHAMLSSRFGGTIPVLPEASGLVPRDTLYRVHIRLDQTPGTLKVMRGEFVIQGKAESRLVAALKPIALLIIRELNF